jgi:hypothetical protein
MEAWRQWLLGGRKSYPDEEQKTNLLDSDRPSHGRRFHSSTASRVFRPMSDIYHQLAHSFRFADNSGISITLAFGFGYLYSLLSEEGF